MPKICIALLLVWGCESSTPRDIPSGIDRGSFAYQADGSREGGIGDGFEACTLDQIRCDGRMFQEVCRGVVPRWVREPCPPKTLCLDGRCAASCRDACALGQERVVGGTTQTCRLLSVAQNKAVSPSEGMHDRARRYNAWLREHHVLAGGLNVAVFKDTTFSKAVSFGGTGDSALWTGAYLAAEALRLKVTGSPDAETNVKQMVEVIHRLFRITGATGYMARYAAPLGFDPRLDALYLDNDPRFFKVTYKGKPFFYRGDPSRDAYQGPLLGYALAYDALDPGPHRDMIRQDIVDFCSELIRLRKGMTVRFQFNLYGMWIDIPFKVDLQHVVLNPAEFVNGYPAIRVGSETDPTDFNETRVMGMQEFFPDYAVVLKKVPLIGPLVTIPIPRSGSTLMVASILRLGIRVTEGEPQHVTQHAAFSAYYKQQISTFLDLMKQYTFLNTECWQKYYGLNITFMPVYNLIQMESDAALRSAFQNDVLKAKMWPYVNDHKNVFFSYIYASHAPPGSASQVISDASAQLALFRPPPNDEGKIDNTALYPANPKCDNQTTVAVDTDRRWPDYFCWQKHPFEMTWSGNPLRVWPGVDYMLPYWMGRAHGFLADDAEGTCLRWQP